MTDLSDAIEENAQGPKQVSSDGHTVTRHSLKEQIEADEYLANKQARTRSTLPISLTRTVPPGSV